jgi:hypothetical protein
MIYLRKETLARIGTTQAQLDGMRMALRRLDELCRDLETVGQALEDTRYPVPDAAAVTVTDLELTRLERELESEVRECLADATIRQR